MAATIARLARMANVFTAYVNLNVELQSSRAGEFGLVRSGLYSQPLFYSPVLCSLPAVFVFTLEAQSSRLLPPFPLSAITKRNLLALICYTLACPASFSPLLSSLSPVVASICAVLHFRASVCISFMAFSLCAQPKNEKSENKTKYSCTSYV